MNEPKLIKMRDDGYRKSYDIEIKGKILTVYDTVSDKGDTHTFEVLSMKKSPTEEEENAAVVFVKGLTDKKKQNPTAIFGTIETRDKTDKPWGEEHSLSSFPQYVMKEIRINAGHRTSLQFHHKKYETLVFVEGEAIIHYKNGMGEIVKMPAQAGTVAEFPPMSQHRVEAKTNIRYFEASTPELPNDTVRIDDDYNRRLEVE